MRATCPAHGARFDPDGGILNRPANVGLAPSHPES